MVAVYVSLCKKGKKNVNVIPANIKDEVLAVLEQDGYLIDEDGWCYKE